MESQRARDRPDNECQRQLQRGAERSVFWNRLAFRSSWQRRLYWRRQHDTGFLDGYLWRRWLYCSERPGQWARLRGHHAVRRLSVDLGGIEHGPARAAKAVIGDRKSVV